MAIEFGVAQHVSLLCHECLAIAGDLGQLEVGQVLVRLSEVFLHAADKQLIFSLQVAEGLFEFLLESLQVRWHFS